MNELELLHVLEKVPRITISDLADILNETAEDTGRAKADLEKRKIICGYHTVINWDRTSEERCMAVIEVSAKPERDCGYDRIADRIARYPEVNSLYLLSGKTEFLAVIKGRTMREVADFVGQKLAPLEGVSSTVTCFVLKQYKVEGMILDEETQNDERLIVTP